MVDHWMGRLLSKLDVLGLKENTVICFVSDHGFYFGEHDYLGKAEWINDQSATANPDSTMPAWLAESWLLTVDRSPLYQELTRVPLIVSAPGLEPGRRSAITTAPDLAPTILDLTGVGVPPEAMQGESFRKVLTRQREEHREFVVSSWPLYFAEGEITTAVDSKPRRIASYMPITTSTPDRSLILGGPGDPPELYDLTNDPHEQTNVWESHTTEGINLIEKTISFLEQQGTAEQYIQPRRVVLEEQMRAAATRGIVVRPDIPEDTAEAV